MKKRIMMVAGSFVMAACLSMSAFGEAEAVAEEAVDAVSNVAMEAAEGAVEAAVGDSAEEAVQVADEAGESVQEATEAVEGIGEELGVAEEAGEDVAGELAQDADVAGEVAQGVAGEVASEGADADHDAHGEYAEGHSAEGMAAWMAISQPGEHHGQLEAYVGQWDVNVSFWMAPGMAPQVNQGSSEVKWILDGRFIQENFQSVMQMGDEPQIFKGFGLTGYDNANNEYVGIWADTMSTVIIESAGQIDQSTGALVLVSEFADPISGEPTSMRTVLTVVSDDEVLMEAYKPLGDQEFKCLEIVYTRRP